MLCYHCMRDKGGAEVCPYCHNRTIPEALPHQMRPGTLLAGRYTLGRVLGEGGFGITYIGIENTLQITVAVKEYYPHGYSSRNTAVNNTVSVISGDKDAFYHKGRARFLNEARTLARFQSDAGIVNVIDFVEENNTAYIIMEYLDGITLREYLKNNGVVKPDEAIRMLMPVMRALEDVHRAGIIHRDISPDNIMMLRDGSLKLMDFGAARDFDSENRSMSVLLKHGYAPEEQYRRNGVQGPWTDVYGICATLYRIITGMTPQDAIERVLRDELRRPFELGIAISPSQENAIMYGLAVHRENRCPNMGTLISLLEGKSAEQYAQMYPGGQEQQTILAFSGNAAPDDPFGTVNAQEQKPNASAGNQVQPTPVPIRPYPKQTPPPTKSKAPMIIAILLAAVAVVVGVITAITLMNNKKEHVKKTGSSSSSVREDTQTMDGADTPEVYEMPDLIGMKEERASEELGWLNLTPVIEEIETDEQEPGKVVNQVPKEGTEVDADTKITLYIAKAIPTERPTPPPTEKPTQKPTEKPEEPVYTPPASTSGTLYCTAETYVSLHDSASTSGRDIRKIWRGQTVEYISTSGNMYYVNASGTYGYAAKQYLSFDESDIPSRTDWLYVNSNVDDLKLRAVANGNAGILASIPPGGKIYFLGVVQDNGETKGDYHVQWAKVEYNGKVGYVHDYYLHD